MGAVPEGQLIRKRGRCPPATRKKFAEFSFDLDTKATRSWSSSQSPDETGTCPASSRPPIHCTSTLVPQLPAASCCGTLLALALQRFTLTNGQSASAAGLEPARNLDMATITTPYKGGAIGWLVLHGQLGCLPARLPHGPARLPAHYFGPR